MCFAEHSLNYSGLSLKRASAVLYRTTFLTGKKQKQKQKKSQPWMPVSVKGLPLTEFDFENVIPPLL